MAVTGQLEALVTVHQGTYPCSHRMGGWVVSGPGWTFRKNV